VQCLEGTGPAELVEMVVDCAAHLLLLTHKADDLDPARAQAHETLTSGAPRRKWDEMLLAQGADLDAFYAKLQRDQTASVVAAVLAPSGGFLEHVDAQVIGEVIRDLGGGRMTKESAVDLDIGVDQIRSRGARIEQGATLCRIHAQTSEQAAKAQQRLSTAFSLSQSPVQLSPRVLEVI